MRFRQLESAYAAISRRISGCGAMADATLLSSLATMRSVTMPMRGVIYDRPSSMRPG